MLTSEVCGGAVNERLDAVENWVRLVGASIASKWSKHLHLCFIIYKKRRINMIIGYILGTLGLAPVIVALAQIIEPFAVIIEFLMGRL